MLFLIERNRDPLPKISKQVKKQIKLKMTPNDNRKTQQNQQFGYSFLNRIELNQKSNAG